jgi:hypothetical protein
MITGYNTDVRHVETVVHVQTEDKGRGNPFIESVIYVAGRVVATKRSSYAELLEQGKGDPEIAAQMDHQHRTIVAAIRAGRFDGKLQGLKGAGGGAAAPARHVSPEAHAQTLIHASAAPADPLDVSGLGLPGEFQPLQGLPQLTELSGVPDLPDFDENDDGPTLDQVILDYLSTEAEHEQLVLSMDGKEEIQPGKVNHLVLRAFSSKSGLPLAGVQVSVKMLSTVADPRTLMVGETDDVGSVEMRLDVPAFARGSAALIISGSSELGRAEIKQLL